jgi:hypothetical protein
MRIPNSYLLRALALVVATVTTLGCAGGLASTLSDSETEKAIESAAADTSFPSAAEAGVAGGSQE